METNGPAVDLLSRVISDMELKALQTHTRKRQKIAFEALRASGKSLLSTPVKKRDSTSK